MNLVRAEYTPLYYSNRMSVNVGVAKDLAIKRSKEVL